MKKVEYHIDLQAIADLAHTGVRRAAIFMGLGLNAAHNPNFKDYELSKLPNDPNKPRLNVELIGPVDGERIEVFKQEFAQWIIACGLKEILEHFGFFLTRLHHDAMVVLQSRDLLKYFGNPEELQENFFGNPGLANKLQELRTRFKVNSEFEQHIVRLYRLRNVFDHNFKTVIGKHVDENNELVVTWLAMDVHGVGVTSGERRSYADLTREGEPEETQLYAGWVQRERRYKLGERVDLDRLDLQEICLFFSTLCIPSVLKSFASFLAKHNVATRN